MTALHVIEQGGASVVPCDGGWNLYIPTAAVGTYANAMLTSYQSRADFSFGIGSRLELTAHAQGMPTGTAGFGFWNHPYGMGIRPPRAVWFFFSSPPSDMPLAKGVPGNGFKAAVFDAQRWPFYALLPFAPIGVLAMRIPALYHIVWPVGQRAIGVDECALDVGLLAAPKRYMIHWKQNGIEFSVDGETMFTTSRLPRGKLGFVVWIDNQYAVVTPQGRVGFGLVAVSQSQALILRDVSLTRP